MRLVSLSLIALLALAACGGQPASTTTAPTPTAETAQAVSESSAEAAQELEYLDFTLDVSGEVTQTLSGTARTNEFGDGRLLRFGPPDFTFQSILTISEDTQPGEYALTTNNGPLSALFSIGLGIKPEDAFGSDVDGTLNLTSLEPFAGSFEFTAANFQGKTITSKGTFNEVPMTATLTVNGASVPPVEVYYSTTAYDPTFSMVGGDNDISVLLNFQPGAVTGEYPVGAFLSETEADVEAIISADGDDLPKLEGILILTDAGVGTGERLSGSFTITASSEDGSQSVTVEGTFTDVPYIG